MTKYYAWDISSGVPFSITVEGNLQKGDVISLPYDVELSVEAVYENESILVACNKGYEDLSNALLKRSLDLQSIQTADDFTTQYRKIHGEDAL